MTLDSPSHCRCSHLDDAGGGGAEAELGEGALVIYYHSAARGGAVDVQGLGGVD